MKKFLLGWVVAFGLLWADSTGPSGAPRYSSESIANSASNLAGQYSPNSFVTIYGQTLAYETQAITPDELRSGTLPTVLRGAPVRVLISNIPANIYYVSPGQVNILIPPEISPGPVTLQLLNNGIAGPAVPLVLDSAAPALFQQDATTVIATHADGTLVTAKSPGRAGEIVILWAAGLGLTNPPARTNQLPQGISPLVRAAEFQVLLNGSKMDSKAIKYAGAAPGFAGLFQINVEVPASPPQDPEIRIGYSGQMSPPNRILPIK